MTGRWPAFSWLIAALFFAPDARSEAGSSDALPEPLVYEFALGLIDEMHPSLLQAEELINAAAADVEVAKARDALSVNLQGRLRWVDPAPTSSVQDRDDHRLSLFASKRLWDFGRTGGGIVAAEQELESRAWGLVEARTRKRLEIMERYFDVLIADLEFAHNEEAMAIGYIRSLRARDRRELGQASDIDVLKTESEYQATRQARYASKARQRASRARLASVLNHPRKLSSTLVPPKLPEIGFKLPNLELLQKLADERNSSLTILRAQVEAARGRVASARAEYLPVLSAEAETAVYSRDLSSNDRWRAGLVLDVPLYQGARVSAQVSKQRAALYGQEAGLEDRRREVQQAVLETWLELESLLIQKQARDAQAKFRELYLDRARAVYEMELRSDLGDAMVELTNSNLQTARNHYQIALAWARLKALTRSEFEDMQP